MAGDVEALIAEFEAEQRERVAAFADRLRAAAVAQSSGRDHGRAAAVKERLEPAAAAFKRHGFTFNGAKFRRLCQKNSGDGGFAVKIGIWYVRQPGFDHLATLVKRNAASF